jgi:serine protease AprX
VDHIVKPDIVAPGNGRISLLASSTATLYANNPSTAVPKNYYQNEASSVASSDYYRLSGTSMATPEVSGAVALMLQQNSSLAPDQVKAAHVDRIQEFSGVQHHHRPNHTGNLCGRV